MATLSVDASYSNFTDSLSVASSGGAVCSSGGTARLAFCELFNVTAPSDGGGVWAATTITLLGTVVRLASTSTGSGGAVFAKTTVFVAESRFSECRARVSGGALSSQSVEVTDSTFAGVSAAQGVSD